MAVTQAWKSAATDVRSPHAVTWIAALFVALLPAWMHRQYLSGDRILYAGATAQEQYPRYKILCDALQEQGRIPLWQDWLYGGSPFHANPENPTLYPPALLLARIASPVWTMNLLVLLHFSFAALGMFLLVRRLWLRLDRSSGAPATALAGATVAATVFSLAGWTRSELLHGVSSGGTLAYLPWLLLATEALLEGERPRRAAGALALLLGLQFLSGGLHAIVYGTYGLALWMFLLGVCAGGERARRALTWGTFALVCAGLIACAKYLPFREWVAVTNRAAALDYRESLGMALGGTGGAFEFAALLKHLAWYTFYGLTPALAATAWPLRRHPVVRVCAAGAAIGFLIALGTPLHRVLYEWLPLIDSTRNAQRSWTGVNAFLPILTGLGVCSWVARWPALAGRAWRSAAVGATAALLLLPALMHSFYYERIFREPERFSRLAGLYLNWPEAARRCGSEWRATSLDLRRPDQRSEQFISTLLEVETPAGYLGHIWPRALERHLHGTAGGAADERARLRRRATLSVRWLVATDPAGAPVSERVLPPGIDGNMLLENPDARQRASAPSAVVAVFDDVDSAVAYALLDDEAFPLRNAATIQLSADRELDDEELAALDALVLRGAPSPSAMRAATALRAAGRRVLEVDSTLTDEDRARLAELARALAPAAGEHESQAARFERERPGASRVSRSDASRARWILVSEPWSLYPGWHASTPTRDGVAIEAADGVSSAVLLRAGETSLRAVYAPRSVTVGLWLLALGTAVALAALCWPRTQRVT